MRTLLLLAALAGLLPTPALAEWVSARVVRVDAERGRITLRHGPIRSVKMAAMTMGFQVADGLPLQAYKPGDRVRFSVVEVDGELRVSKIEAVR
ncbi:MAG TPA: copper-binding protein [Caldimonas sp.]|jgi:Cu/Ag efflux protein CusF|nr:copper-binding protein [Caldimonas sp.]HEX2541132.1 copper-binding protein [Caldimonas sp.]